MDGECLRICLWSGPRNVSTALMYSFAERPDTEVFDEPLYGHYLRVSGADHPGREGVLDAMDTDGDRVVREVVLGPATTPVRFFKMMAHHLTGLDESFLDRTTNVLLTRDPREVLATLPAQIPEPTLRDTGYDRQIEILQREQTAGREPVVLDARELLQGPETVLRELCARLRIDFHEGMLSWKPGPRAYDGPWAPYWYHNVRRSTGFIPYRRKEKPVPAPLYPLLEQCQPLYEELHRHAIAHA